MREYSNRNGGSGRAVSWLAQCDAGHAMAMGEVVNSMAIGVGCRKNCTAAAIVALVQAALIGLPEGPAALYTIEDKAGQKSLKTAAGLLGLPLYFVTRVSIEAVMPQVQTRSSLAKQLFGVASVAEGAALAGAGQGARLLVARIAANGATCAIAAFHDGLNITKASIS